MFDKGKTANLTERGNLFPRKLGENIDATGSVTEECFYAFQQD